MNNPPPHDGRVDLATARRMVQEAVVRATAAPDKTAAVIAARVEAATRRAARINMLLTLAVVGTLIAAGVASFTVYKSQQAARVLANETGLDRAPAARPSGTLPTQVFTGREIFERNRGALYLMGYTKGRAIGGCCTAFAIGPNLLATNAHCVIACAKTGTPIVTQNDSGGKTRLQILAAVAHPAYKRDSQSSDSPDVGLLRVDGRLPTTVTFANDAELRSIGPGDDAFVLGFPGRVMDPLNPSATFLQGRIGRTMGFDEEPTTADKAVLIQHDAVTRGGNSGSPIFNQYGHVIAIHAAHIDDEDDVQLDGRKTKVVNSSPFRLGMRIDLIRGVPAP
jgi:hypothetical protein